MNKKYVDSGTRISIDEQDLTGKFSIAVLELLSERLIMREAVFL